MTKTVLVMEPTKPVIARRTAVGILRFFNAMDTHADHDAAADADPESFDDADKAGRA